MKTWAEKRRWAEKRQQEMEEMGAIELADVFKAVVKLCELNCNCAFIECCET